MKSDTAPGLDGWTVDYLKSLPSTCLRSLATLLQAVETTGVWPKALSMAKVTLIPKTDGSADPGAQRPITVMSVVYRLWASTRLHQCEDWQSEYLPWHMHGFCKGRSVEDGIWQASMRIEEASATETPLYGFSMDIAKAAPRPAFCYFSFGQKRLACPPMSSAGSNQYRMVCVVVS